MTFDLIILDDSGKTVLIASFDNRRQAEAGRARLLCQLKKGGVQGVSVHVRKEGGGF